MRTKVEYVWIDGHEPTKHVRSKTKIVEFKDGYLPSSATEFPVWGFDGSSTYQAEGHSSDRVLVPMCFIKDPLRAGEEHSYSVMGTSLTTRNPHYIVLCEVFMPDGVTPHPSNTRAKLREVLDAGAAADEPWVGIEQEYTLMRDGRILGWPDRGYPPPQGPFYCGVGADEVAGRAVVEAHMDACLNAGILLAGVNAEVLLGQWEFQVGTGDPLTISDHLWLARWLLYRVGEDHGVSATLHPKPAQGDWNGTGAHTNFSTAAMRHTDASSYLDAREGGVAPLDGLWGMAAIEEACKKLSRNHAEHIAVYGSDNAMRLTGRHETCDINTFRYGVADRGASIRIPGHVAAVGHGYLEDRRPAANADPYEVCARILRTVCLE